MQELLNQLLEKAKQDKKTLQHLKNTAVRAQNFELASNLRAIEIECFPESSEVKKAKEDAKYISLLFRMVELNVSEPTCWLISEAMKQHKKKKGKFSLEDASTLMAKKKEIFEED